MLKINLPNFCLLLFAFCLSLSAQTLTVRDIMREPSLAGMRPENEKLSPDGKTVVFSWNAEGKEPRNLYIVSTGGGEPQILVDAEKNFEMRSAAPESKLNYGLTVRDDFVKAREKNLGGAEFSPNSKRLLFVQNSDIYLLEITDNVLTPRRITRTQGAEFAARWLDDATILYQSNGNFYSLNIEKTSLVQLSREANPQTFVSVSSAAPTEDAALLAYIVSDSSKQRALFVPNYLDEFVQAPTFRRGFTEQKVLVVKTDGSLEKPFEVKIPKPEGAGYVRSLDWAADNRSLIVDRVDKDTKRRQLFYIYNVGSKDEQIITLTEESDEKWVGSLSRIVEPNPTDNSQILFASERDGYNHLYLATLEKRPAVPNPTGEIRQENPTNAGFTPKVEIKQLTKGNFEIDWAKWEFQGNSVIYSSTAENTSARQFNAINVSQKERTNWSFTPYKLPNAKLYEGMKTNPQLEHSVLLYRYSEWNKPDELYTANGLHNSGLKRDVEGLSSQITKTTPAVFTNRKWNAPKFIDIPARDGKPIKSKIYTPADFDKSKKYPLAIFVHGAGYLQNTINGWNNYYREFMFNQMLTQKGYVVLDIDYRGSLGYGRDWRTDVHDFLGGKDYEDHLDAIDFAVKNYAVDEKRVGVYGGSYGGFMAGMLVMRSPDKIAAAAALRPVFDWKNYYASSPVYTAERLGFPDKNPEAYQRSSPINYADKLQKPLLILHGLLDDNVPAQDSIQLIEKLIRLEKTEYFEAMLYPAENHGFTRPTSWTDEYGRILSFFEKHLK